MNEAVDIAIVGMAGIFPGAENIQTFWRNICEGRDAIQSVPPQRMESLFFDEAAVPAVDRFYCNRGGFIDDYARFDPVPFGILPVSVSGTEPEHLLMLNLAHTALEDARLIDREDLRRRTAIIIGKGNYAGPGATRAIEIVRMGEQLVQLLRELMPEADESTLQRVKQEYQARKGRFAPDTAMGLIPNLVASLVANRLDFGGAAYTVDAACASSLVAVDHAIRELRSDRADMVLAAGMHVSQNAPFWSIFTQLGALSRSQQIRPFDRRADGLLIGEGCGVVVLRRLEDARAEGQRIYAVIKGVGISSDGAGVSVMSPTVDGQLRAVQSAWQQAGLDPAAIGYLEAHGTGTPLGDRIELETLSRMFGLQADRPHAAIGTIKSMIGHAMPAAGIAGLIKMALALHHGQLPPTLHCEEPVADFLRTRFRPLGQTGDWDDSGLPRVAGVNAFGFGGINAHVVLQAEEAPRDRPQAHTVELDPVRVLARDSAAALITALETGDKRMGSGKYRLVVFDPSPDRIKRAIKIVQRGTPWRNRQDIWFSGSPLIETGGKVAFLFPGLDALAGGEAESIASYFNLPLHPYENEAGGVLASAMDVLKRSHVFDTALKQLGIIPDLNAGHSLGEWLAGRSSGLATEESVAELLHQLDPTRFELRHTRFLVVGAGADVISPLLTGVPDMYLAIDNCPQQVILCGTVSAVEHFSEILRQRQLFHQPLPFQSGFHSPFLENQLDYLLAGLDRMTFRKVRIPLWSATTLCPYPEDAAAIRKLSVEHLVKPVRFRELINHLYHAEKVRCFVQVGAGGLIGFVDDTLKGQDYSAIAAGSATRSGIEQMRRVVAALFVEGHAGDLSVLGIQEHASLPERVGAPLQLGSPLIRGFASLTPLRKAATPTAISPVVPSESVDHELVEAFFANVQEMHDAQATVLKQLSQRMPSPRSTSPQTLRQPLDISLSNAPYLRDHALVRQPAGWPHAADTDPVIPMTMVIELLAEAVQSAHTGTYVKRMSQVQVFKWLNVTDPFRETIEVQHEEEHGPVTVKLGDYAQATVWLDKQFNLPHVEIPEIGRPLDIEISPETIYRNHLFHGPAYQGIRQVIAVHDRGIRGVIQGGTGKGSLLDNAGQLFGLWLQLTLPTRKVAFPVRIEAIDFYADLADQGGPFTCTCVSTQLSDEFATADIFLERDGKRWAHLRGWQNRRLEIDNRLWNVSMDPLNNFLSEEIAPGICFFHKAYQRVVSWDFIMKRYLNGREKQHLHSLGVRQQKAYLVSRVAAKDALRLALLRNGARSCFPVELDIAKDAVGKPVVIIPSVSMPLAVSIAHKGDDGVAIAAIDRPVGIDMEEIADRGAGFADLVLTEAEQALIADRDRAEWTTRCWVAKEAYGKYLGQGLKGNPKAYEVTAINDTALTIKNIKIQTIIYKNYIIGWTT